MRGESVLCVVDCVPFPVSLSSSSSSTGPAAVVDGTLCGSLGPSREVVMDPGPPGEEDGPAASHGPQLTCCVAGGGGTCDRGPQMERWCLRRRRKGRQRALGPQDEGLASDGCERCRQGMDYHLGCDDHSCDSDGCSESPTFRQPPADRLPRHWICGEDGPAGGGGVGPEAPRGDARRALMVGPSLWAGDGAAVHLPPASGIAEDSSGVSGRGTRRCGGLVSGWCWGRGARGSVVLVTLLWLLVLVCGASASIMGDGCDWSGSGLMAEMEVSREGGGVGVRPVYLRCSQGAVSWAYPRGALRVLLRLAGGDEFRGCVRLGRTWKGARLFLEGVRSLHPLFPGVEDGGEAKGAGVRCFQSRKGQAALYVEATPGGVSPRGRTVASFEYHLQPLPSGVKTFDPSEECRPCTMDEMTHAFCSSDLVTRGTIRSVETRDDPETSELKVRVTKLIRRTRAPPPALEGDHEEDGEDEIREEAPEKERQPRHWWNAAATAPGERGGASVTLHVPTHCGARHGAGEFVFMAQRKLGQLRLKCAPRLEDWAELARRSNRLAASPCVLQA